MVRIGLLGERLGLFEDNRSGSALSGRYVLGDLLLGEYCVLNPFCATLLARGR